MKVRVLQMAGQDCEPVSFARLMGELKPIDYSQLAGTVVLDEDEWDEWREDLAHAHEREIEIERKCSADAYFRGVNDATDAVFDSATDDLLAERGLMRLPVDADGEPIHAGDVLDGYGKTIEVVELRYGRSGWVLISRDGNGYADTFAFTHHHAPTVEDVLREFAYGLGVPVADSYVAAAAAKLRLAGENA